MRGGEAFDWFYASDAAREAQVRTPITDGLGKPWIYRAKDLQAWWSNPHHERAGGGAELASPTAWVPKSKPIWLTEIGCPAVDKGANSPNLFPDPKSAAAALPPFPSGERDDLVQRRAVEAVLGVYGAASSNPVSPLYGGRMVDPERTAVWTWDARPYPAFPSAEAVWADGSAWQTGHWLTGRLGQTSLAELAAAILIQGGAEAFDTGGLEGLVDGYAMDRPASAREALEPLADLFNFAVFERDGVLVLTTRRAAEPLVLTDGSLAADREQAAPHLVRGQESEMPREVAVGFADAGSDFQARVATARRRGTEARGVVTYETALVASPAEMQRCTEIRLQDMWIGRETASFAVAPTAIALEPGDTVALHVEGERRLFEVAEISDGPLRRVSARSIAPDIFAAPRAPEKPKPPRLPQLGGTPVVVVLDLPAGGTEPPVLSRLAVAAKPWPGRLILWKESGGSFEPVRQVTVPAILGQTLDVLGAGPVWRFDAANAVHVRISQGELSSATDARLFEGANAAAVRKPDGRWEILQFGGAELVGPSTYRLSRLLRGQSGTEAEAKVQAPPGSTFVLLDGALVPLAEGVDMLGRPTNWRIAPASRDFSDPSAVAFSAEAGPEVLAPLSPVHVRATRTPAGISVSWIRRTRAGGDGWGLAEVPLGEASERYRVEILNGGDVVRTLETASPAFLYQSADEAADFGAPRAQLSLRVSQMSAVAGSGTATEVTLDV